MNITPETNPPARTRGPKTSGFMTSEPTFISQKKAPLRYENLKEFITCYNPENRDNEKKRGQRQ
jgi:hypothetical protein